MQNRFFAFIFIFINFFPLFSFSQNIEKNISKKPKVSEEFGIFLLKDKKYVDVLNVDINKLKLQKKPIVSTKDIIFCSKNAHEIILTPFAYKRLMGTSDTHFPFVVCVGEKRIYAGSVWSGILSASFGGIVIMKEMNISNTNTIHFELGYPTPKYFTGVDLRDDPKIIHALEKAGKVMK